MSTLPSIGPDAETAVARESSTSRKSNKKHVEFGNDIIQVLPSEGNSHEGDDGENNVDLEFVPPRRNHPEWWGLTLSRLEQKQLNVLLQQASKPDAWPGQIAATVRARQEAVVARLKKIQETRYTRNRFSSAFTINLT